jgi:pyruvate dehydrogenase E2 component (dihydrolipoamide acetyltransferase)
MIKVVKLPKMGMAMREATIVRLFKKEGDKVKEEEALLEIMTEKIVNEIGSPVDGVIVEVKVKEGDIVPIGTPLICIEEEVSSEEEEEVSSEINGIEKTLSIEGHRMDVAMHMKKSWEETPMVTEIMSIDMTNILKIRQTQGSQWQEKFGIKPSLNDIIVRAAAQVLVNFKILNATISNDSIHIYKNINVGIAVTTESDMLVVPVIKEADKKSLIDIARESKILIQKVRNEKLESEDLRGATFTITNLGMYGVNIFTPIVPFPQAAILGVSAINDTPVVIAGEIMIRSIMNLGLTFNHEVINGALAAKFISRMKETLENFESKFIDN